MTLDKLRIELVENKNPSYFPMKNTYSILFHHPITDELVYQTLLEYDIELMLFRRMEYIANKENL